MRPAGPSECPFGPSGGPPPSPQALRLNPMSDCIHGTALDAPCHACDVEAEILMLDVHPHGGVKQDGCLRCDLGLSDPPTLEPDDELDF